MKSPPCSSRSTSQPAANLHPFRGRWYTERWRTSTASIATQVTSLNFYFYHHKRLNLDFCATPATSAVFSMRVRPLIYQVYLLFYGYHSIPWQCLSLIRIFAPVSLCWPSGYNCTSWCNMNTKWYLSNVSEWELNECIIIDCVSKLQSYWG